jgi:hypothetical protein
MSTTTRTPEGVRTVRSSRRLPLTAAGLLILIGAASNTIVSRFHPSKQDPNDHPAVFAEYAASTDWIWVHYAQFAAVMLLLGGFVILHKVIAGGSPRIVDQLVFVATIMSAAALTVLQAVDGVALKHAVDAWAAATGPEQTARFGDAETMRWLEWGVNSFFYSLVGLMVGLSGLAIVTRAVVPRWLGWSAVLSGVGLIINAVPVGFQGFNATPAGMVGVLLLGVTAVGITVIGLRRTQAEPNA